MTTTKPLTETQMLVLSHAAQRSDLSVLPLPTTVRARGSVKRNILAAMLKMDMFVEAPVTEAGLAWRTDEAGQQYGLHLSPVGYFATCLPPATPGEKVSSTEGDQRQDQGPANDNPVVIATAQLDAAPRSPSGKLGQVLIAISSETGATLTEITTLTGWLPHTARAALTGLRQRGFPIQLVEADGRKTYRRAAAG